jgi:hypothetical protein
MSFRFTSFAVSRIFLMTGSVIILAQGANAAGVGQVIDFSIPQEYVSPRALGMGNAFVGLADDYNAIFYNPAGLARLQQAQVNLGVDALLDSKVVGFKNDLTTASGSGNVQNMVNLLDSDFGNYYAARASIAGFWARTGWEIAIIPVDIQASLAIHQLGGAAADLLANQDTTIAFARGWDVHWFKQDRMSLGVTGKLVYRGAYNHEFEATDLAFSSTLLRSQDADEGLTGDFDIGSLWTPKIAEDSWWRFLRPSVGFVMRNVLDYGFPINLHLVDQNTSTQPPNLGRRYDLGSVWELPDLWIFKTHFLADMRDMGTPNFTYKKGTHLGAEFLWKIRNWWQGGWRIGVNQGYFSAGFTGKLGIFNLDLATYAEEVGPSNVPLASRQYVAKASIDW